MTEREKIIEAMARAICATTGMDPSENEFLEPAGRPCNWQFFIKDAESALTALSDQGYAVVPRNCPSDARFKLATLTYAVGESHGRLMPIASADLAPPSIPATEEKAG